MAGLGFNSTCRRAVEDPDGRGEADRQRRDAQGELGDDRSEDHCEAAVERPRAILRALVSAPSLCAANVGHVRAPDEAAGACRASPAAAASARASPPRSRLRRREHGHARSRAPRAAAPPPAPSARQRRSSSRKLTPNGPRHSVASRVSFLIAAVTAELAEEREEVVPGALDAGIRSAALLRLRGERGEVRASRPFTIRACSSLASSASRRGCMLGRCGARAPRRVSSTSSRWCDAISTAVPASARSRSSSIAVAEPNGSRPRAARLTRAPLGRRAAPQSGLPALAHAG